MSGPGASEDSTVFKVDLDNCEREPIHISGAVQPHGLLFVLSVDLQILQLSCNTQELLGIDHRALLGRSVDEVLDDDGVNAIRALVACGDEVLGVNSIRTTSRDGARIFDAILHGGLHKEGLILELEVASTPAELSFTAFYQQARGAVARLLGVRGVAALCQKAVGEVRSLTGFDRVMAYRFDRDDHGHVIAEDVREGLESYLDLHYPASDIPAQARRLYTINRLRMIADTGYRPVPIVPALSPVTNAPLDLSFSVLRSVSPIHIEYLQNMGIQASMSISLILDGKLWGLVICHHYSPRLVPYDVRAACDFLSQTLSWQIGTSERADAMEKRALVDDRLRGLIQTLSEDGGLRDGLTHAAPRFLELVDAAGGALVHAGEVALFGATPSPDEVARLVDWLRSGDRPLPFHADDLAARWPEAARYEAVAAGLLAVPLDRDGESYLLWFRPEVTRTVNWAGDPNKTASVKDGAPRLSPRGSFALWKETVRGRSQSWLPWQVTVAVDLGHAVASIVLKRAALLETLNRELQVTSEELRAASLAKDEFLATISHELRTPLNAMLGWLRLIRGKTLDPVRNANAVEIVERNARAQAKLVEDLIDVSRIISGKMRLEVQAVNLFDVMQSALDSVRPSVEAKGLSLHPVLDPRASIIMGDGARLQQVLWNLLANAVKFTPKGGRVQVQLTRSESSASITISDSGEGIAPEFLPHVFERFRQAQGGSARTHQGLGLGLAIVRHLVELHGGTVSVASEGQGRGALFTVQLPLSPVSRERVLPPVADVEVDAGTGPCPPQLRDLRILVLDDEPDARELLVTEVSRCAATVVAAASAAEALRLVGEVQPHVIISDIGMPGEDGYAFIKALRALPVAAGGRTPAIALTAYAGSRDRTRAFLAGFQAHLPKPVEPGELFAVLLSVSGRSHGPAD